MEKIDVWISGVTDVGNYTLYDMKVRLNFDKFKFKEFQVSKRFSDFITFRKSLCNEGYAYIPELPSRFTSFLKSNESIIAERKEALLKLTNYVLNDDELRAIDQVLLFYHIPNADMKELKATIKESGNVNLEYKVDIDSSSNWAEVYRNVKSQIQNIRIKINSSDNAVEITQALKTTDLETIKLKKYLDHSEDLSVEERKRRYQLLNSLITETSDLLNMVKLIRKDENTSNPVSNASTTRTTSRRTFGKPVETEDTRKLNNSEFLQSQQLQMKSQDQDLEELRGIIMRQKQLGIAVNDELNIQSELLDGLDKHVDYSSDRMNLAKSKIKRFT